MAACCQRDERLLAPSGSGQMANLRTNFSMALQDRKNGENTDQFIEFGPVLSQKCKPLFFFPDLLQDRVLPEKVNGD